MGVRDGDGFRSEAPGFEATPARFPCAQCGANLAYDPNAEQLVCSYCGHVNHIEPAARGAIPEVDFRKALGRQISETEIETTRVVTCGNCGAATERPENRRAERCPYCDSPLVGDAGENRHFRPKGVLPFAIDEKTAQTALGDWLGSRWFAPSNLRAYARADKRLTGVYTPFWTFDADTVSAYAGRRGDVYYVQQRVVIQTKDGPRETVQNVPRIRWTPARGRVRRFFDDILVLASRGLPKAHADELAPWDLHALVPYRADYLAGFVSEAYTIDLEAGFAEARGVMDLQIRRDVRFDIGGDHQEIDSIDTQIGQITFKHILLPVWVAAYRYGGKSYQFVVNGRSGKVRGDRPYSAWKITAAFVAGMIVAMLVGSVLYANGAFDDLSSGGRLIIEAPGLRFP